VAEETWLDVFGPEWLAQERIVEEIDLPNGEVVRRAPVGVDAPELVRGLRARR
jgi:hypothetical protein